MIIIGKKNESELLRLMSRKGAGSMVSYFGYVRGFVKDKAVAKMICRETGETRNKMEEIEAEIRDHFPVLNVLLYHSTGELRVGELVAAVLVSTVHREEGFKACRFGIDKIKELEPVKREDVFKN